MMMMNEKEQVADDVWRELEGDSLATGLVVRRFPISTHTVWLVQVRPSGQLQLSLLSDPSMSRDAVLEQLPTVRGLEYIFAPLDAYEQVLHIRVSESALNEQFKAMTQDLLTSLVIEKSNSVQVVAKRLLLWQKMFKRLNEKLNDNEVLGLFGELHILRQLCEITENSLNALEKWIGPSGGAQDFRNDSKAIEIKTTLVEFPAVVHISSEWQLDLNDLSSLTLAVVYAKESDSVKDCMKLPDLITEFRSKFKSDKLAANLFEQRLIEARYFDKHASLYTKTYAIHNQQNYTISSDSPVLNNTNIPSGIKDVSYDLNTAGLVKSSLSNESMFIEFMDVS